VYPSLRDFHWPVAAKSVVRQDKVDPVREFGPDDGGARRKNVRYQLALECKRSASAVQAPLLSTSDWPFLGLLSSFLHAEISASDLQTRMRQKQTPGLHGAKLRLHQEYQAQNDG